MGFKLTPMIRRGDIWLIRDAKSMTQYEKGGHRPAVIVSNNKGNTYSPNVEIVFLTTKKKKPLPTHAKVYCNRDATALCETIQTIPKTSLIGFIRHCSQDEIDDLNSALIASLGIYEEDDHVEY